MSSTASAATGGRWQATERWLIVLIALHSAAIGVGALVATEWGVRFSGFEGASPLFFPRQVGVFHVVVAAAYLIEHVRHRSVTILLTTKGIAVVFLCAMIALDSVPWVVPASAAGDALMWLAAFVAHRLATRESRSPLAGAAGA